MSPPPQTSHVFRGSGAKQKGGDLGAVTGSVHFGGHLSPPKVKLSPISLPPQSDMMGPSTLGTLKVLPLYQLFHITGVPQKCLGRSWLPKSANLPQ